MTRSLPRQLSALAWTVAQARELLPVVSATIGGGIADYVRILVDLLRQARIQPQPAACRMLYRSAMAIHAAALALDPSGRTPAESVLLAVHRGLPQRAQGIALPDVKILAAHKEAWRLAKLKAGDPMLAILTPPTRSSALRLAVAASALNTQRVLGIVADVLAQSRPGAAKPASSTCSRPRPSAG